MKEKLKVNMGSEDNKMMEEALNDLREQNDKLRDQNRDLKLFLVHLNNEISNFLRYDAIKKEL
jgi:hypothetical protein